MRVLFAPCGHPDSAWLFKALQESGHSLQRADDVSDAILLAELDTFDAVIATALDAHAYRALNERLDAFIASARAAVVVTVLSQSTPADRVRMLRAGVDACFCQPLSFIELHERLHALFRARGARITPSLPAPQGLKLQLDSHELVAGSKRVTVTRREYLLLECLLRQFDAPVARDQLIRYAWPDSEFVEPSNLNPAITRLRQKLKQGLSSVCIKTVNRYGYQLTQT